MNADLSMTVETVTERDWETEPIEATVRIAVIGLGDFAERHALPAIAESDYCEATVGISGSAEKATDFADRFDLDAGITYEEYHEGAAVDAYDAVYVVTPNALHLPHVETAVQQGKDVICEKPLEANIERAEQVVEACEDAGVTLMVAYRMQAEPLTRRLRELAVDGAIGEVTQAHGAFCGHVVPADPDPENPPWRHDPDLAGGGALYDVGIYPLNTIRFVLDQDPEAVSGHVAMPHEAFDVDEHASFQLAFDDGVAASCRTSYNSHGDSYFEILGTEGRVRLEPAFGVADDRVATLENEAGTVELSAIDTNELVEEFDYFAYCTQTGTTPEPDGHEGVTDMEIMAGVYESDETGRRVDL